MARTGKARLGLANHRVERLDSFKRLGVVGRGMARTGRARQVQSSALRSRKFQRAWRGMARPGMAWTGKSNHRVERPDSFKRQGMERLGRARTGVAWTGKANHRLFGADSFPKYKPKINDTMIKLNLNIRGIRPIIMHNGRTADPLDPWAKKLKSVSSKRKKTEEDHELMSEIEFEAGLYWSDDLGVYMPADNLQRMFLDACKKIRMGRESIGIMIDTEYGCPLVFTNHKNLKKLKADPEARIRKIVGLTGVKVVRTRPLIPTGWTMEIPIELDPDLIDRDTFEQIAEIAGHRIGMGDWRPGAPRVPGSFGRFVVESISNGSN